MQVSTTLGLESFTGRATKFKLPEMGVKTEDHRPSGGLFDRKLNMGIDGSLEGTFSVVEWSASLNAIVGLSNGSNTIIVLRGSLADDEMPNTTVPILINMRAMITKRATGDIETGNKIETEYTYNAKFYQEIQDGVVVYHLDYGNYVWIVNGIDMLASQRSDLGL